MSKQCSVKLISRNNAIAQYLSYPLTLRCLQLRRIAKDSLEQRLESKLVMVVKDFFNRTKSKTLLSEGVSVKNSINNR